MADSGIMTAPLNGRVPGLRVSFVGSLVDIVNPVITHLSDTVGRDLFAPDHIIVPNAGVRAWLLQHVATRLGASPGGSDGIVARVEVGYLGMLNRFLLGDRTVEDDPWSIEAMTMAIVRRLGGSSSYAPLLRRHDGRALRAGRVMADRFDAYHARRPRMIEEWEAGHAVLVPEIGDQVAEGEWLRVERDLPPADRWQFDLWQEVRETIDLPPPPVQLREALSRLERGEVDGLPDRLLVVGLQSVPSHHLGILAALGRHLPVDVYLIHPSPALGVRWAEEASRFLGAREAIDIRRIDPAASLDDFASLWLQGSRDMQILLATHGIEPVRVPTPQAHGPETLLDRVKRRIAVPSRGPDESLPVAPPDRSIAIHRGHTLARQVEILHDALLHAFTDIKDLEPHEVVILCADMAAAAPHLEAVFHRDVPVVVEASADGLAQSTTVRIPLVVADRGLREVSESALVLTQLIGVLTGRVSRSDLLGLFDHESVLDHVGMGSEVIEFWSRLLEASGMRWGLSDEHRAIHGLDVSLADAYSWISTLRQSMLGVLVPDAIPAHEFAGVPALVDLDTADVPAVAALIRLVGIVMRAESATRNPGTIGQWCDLVEQVLIELCGTSGDVESVIVELSRLRRAVLAAGEAAEEIVDFDDVAPLLQEILTAVPGRQPLRTGAVTATSMVPLRSVPFRVVCVLGYDDSAVTVTDIEGDDLRGRQRLVGDPDPRIDVRRSLIDALLSAQERFILTCLGRSARNNTPVPFVTSLAELVDHCVAAGGTRAKTDDGEEVWSFVHDHPRHAFSEPNFAVAAEPGSVPVIPADGRPWSHDLGALHAAEQVAASSSGSSLVSVPELSGIESPTVFSVDDLVRVLTYPLDFYFESIGVDKWDDILRETPDEAVILMDVSKAAKRRLFLEWGAIVDDIGEFHLDAWRRGLRQRGAIPVGKVGDDLVDDLVAVVARTRELLGAQGFTSTVPVQVELAVTLPSGRRIEQVIARPESHGVSARYAYLDENRDKDEARLLAVLELLVRRASGDDDAPGAVVLPAKAGVHQVYRVTLSDDIDRDEATARLEALLDAIETARRVPVVAFGKAGAVVASSPEPLTGARQERLLDEFDEVVGAENYLQSREAMFYGESPDVAVVCDEDSPWHRFWRCIGRASGWKGSLKPTHSPAKRELPGSPYKVTGYVLS